MRTNTWSNEYPSDEEVVAIVASRLRTFKQDVRERIDEAMPIGAIMEWPLETAPDGFKHCNAQSLAVSSYPILFSVIGYYFGGSGANFNLPDSQGAFIRCFRSGKTGVDLDADAATSCTGNISGSTVSSVTGLAGVPRLGAMVTGTGIPTGTYIATFTGYSSAGIPTGFTLTQSCTTGTSIAITIDNNINGSMQYDVNKSHSHGVRAKDVLPGMVSTVFSKNANQNNTGASGGNESRPKNTSTMYIIRTDTV